MYYTLGRRLCAGLLGLYLDFVRVLDLAIQMTRQDFSVRDGRRTVTEGRVLVRRRASRALISRRLSRAERARLPDSPVTS